MAGESTGIEFSLPSKLTGSSLVSVEAVEENALSMLIDSHRAPASGVVLPMSLVSRGAVASRGVVDVYVYGPRGVRNERRGVMKRTDRQQYC
jgi:hypothetical protein